ncbi:hypothetical protein B0H19DRAFT_1086347 [Mycena capillaripes]|nr:hypothetical protein B0H19DRAFT_1086347 [Mycena capillaripes]
MLRCWNFVAIEHFSPFERENYEPNFGCGEYGGRKISQRDETIMPSREQEERSILIRQTIAYADWTHLLCNRWLSIVLEPQTETHREDGEHCLQSCTRCKAPRFFLTLVHPDPLCNSTSSQCAAPSPTFHLHYPYRVALQIASRYIAAFPLRLPLHFTPTRMNPLVHPFETEAALKESWYIHRCQDDHSSPRGNPGLKRAVWGGGTSLSRGESSLHSLSTLFLPSSSSPFFFFRLSSSSSFWIRG